MINLRNTGDYQVIMQIAGTLTASPGITEATIVRPGVLVSTFASYGYAEPLPFNGYLKSVWAYERIPGSSTSTSGNGDGVDIFYFPPVVTTGSGLPAAGGITSTLNGISFCQPAYSASAATGTVMFNMASSTLNNQGYNQVPLISWNPATATSAALGGYGAIYSTVSANLSQNPPLLQRGGILMLVCRTVASTPGTDFQCALEVVRQRQGSTLDPVQIGTYGADSDVF